MVDNLRVAARLAEDRPAAIETTFSRFPVLRERSGQKAGTLSGGEQQMLSLGRALMTDPRLIIVDEPSLGLAPRMIDMVFDCLSEAKARGIGLVVVEQFAHRALAIAERCIILKRGRIVWSGDSSEAPDALSATYLGE